jgi:RNA polymerase sigma-70 factor (ECF subfamily)
VPAAFASEAESESQLPQAMLETVSRLRAFAVVLCGDEELGDELTTTTLIRASVGITLESIDQRLLTWLVSRLRTYFYKEYASFVAKVEQDEKNEKRSQERAADDSLQWLAKLTVAERETLALIDAIDCSLSEAANVYGCSLYQLKAQSKDRLASAEASLARLQPKMNVGRRTAMTAPSQSAEGRSGQRSKREFPTQNNSNRRQVNASKHDRC